MNFESVETEKLTHFQPEEAHYYGSSPVETVREDLEKLNEQQRFMAESVSIGFAQGEEIDIDAEVPCINMEEVTIDADDLVQELEETDEEDEVNFVEENSLMVGY
jgi:hypothetical protein